MSALADLEALRERLAGETQAEVAGQGVEHGEIAVTVWAHLRYDGTDTALPVLIGDAKGMRDTFEAMHRQRFGFVSPEKRVDHRGAGGGGGGRRCKAARRLPLPRGERAGVTSTQASPPRGERSAASGERSTRALLLRPGVARCAGLSCARCSKPGVRLAGPALVIEPHQTVVVEPGWSLEVSARDDLVLRRTTPRKREVLGKTADPVLLEVFNNLFMSIAEQMGEALRNTAQSVNIKERLDFSCAVFDAKGELVANAPHMPMHLGSMDRSVETVIRAQRGQAAGPAMCYMLNAPYNGGTHLPDITVITPVFDEAGGEILFYVASRGHQEDIGGLAPGSMTPRATTIEEEGVYIDDFKLVDQGRFLEAETHALLTGAKYPARMPGKNIADLKAHVAANAKGVEELRQDGGAVRSRRGQGLHAARAGQRRGERAAAAVAARRRRVPGGDGPGHLGRREDHGRSREPPRARGFLGHLARSSATTSMRRRP